MSSKILVNESLPNPSLKTYRLYKYNISPMVHPGIPILAKSSLYIELNPFLNSTTCCSNSRLFVLLTKLNGSVRYSTISSPATFLE
jgi:hypothetical protein